jgi:4-hydroxy-2-oxoheptanedioate aldolase
MKTDTPSRKPVIGTMLRITKNPAIGELAKNAGLGMIMIDCEHAAYSWPEMADIFLAARLAKIKPFIRIPELSRANVSRSLDCGAMGIMVPMLETVEQAENLVKWAKYTPIGGRGLSSIGGHTKHEKLKDASEFMKKANDQTMTIAQIETVEGVENVDGIAATEGIDALLVGPNDLALSLGHPGQLDCPKQNQAIEKVVAAAKKHGKIFGMHAGIGLLEKWIPSGMELIMCSMDVDMLLNSMKGIRNDVGKLL